MGFAVTPLPLAGEERMKLRYRITGILLLLVLIGVSVLAVMLSRNTDCPTTALQPSEGEQMKANVHRCYGSPEVLELASVVKPSPADNEVLVKVRAAAVNPLDWHYMRGTPYIVRIDSGLGAPQKIRLGVDYSGTVEAVGKDVTRFKPGDEVFGGRTGAFAEYVTVGENSGIVLKPSNVSHAQAAAVPVAAITALQALRDRGGLQAGQKVLINGASGGVGTFAVQIAKSMGAEVTGVCSARNAEMVRSIGADHVIDYTSEDYTESGLRYDVIVDMVGNHTLSRNRKVMTPKGVFIIIGGGRGNWFGPFANPFKALLYSPFVGQQFGMMISKMQQDDLHTLAGMLSSGDIVPVIDRSYPLDGLPDAIRYSEEGHARGKIVIDVE
jgi:NADPH:quinone reductase-like Zn-dependent oxidoreductase